MKTAINKQHCERRNREALLEAEVKLFAAISALDLPEYREYLSLGGKPAGPSSMTLREFHAEMSIYRGMPPPDVKID